MADPRTCFIMFYLVLTWSSFKPPLSVSGRSFQVQPKDCIKYKTKGNTHEGSHLGQTCFSGALEGRFKTCLDQLATLVFALNCEALPEKSSERKDLLGRKDPVHVMFLSIR